MPLVICLLVRIKEKKKAHHAKHGLAPLICRAFLHGHSNSTGLVRWTRVAALPVNNQQIHGQFCFASEAILGTCLFSLDGPLKGKTLNPHLGLPPFLSVRWHFYFIFECTLIVRLLNTSPRPGSPEQARRQRSGPYTSSPPQPSWTAPRLVPSSP